VERIRLTLADGPDELDPRPGCEHCHGTGQREVGFAGRAVGVATDHRFAGIAALTQFFIVLPTMIVFHEFLSFS
jgi:hypothetical protein